MNSAQLGLTATPPHRIPARLDLIRSAAGLRLLAPFMWAYTLFVSAILADRSAKTGIVVPSLMKEHQ